MNTRFDLRSLVATLVLLGAGFGPATAATVTLLPIARQGEASPDGNGVYDDYFHFGDPCLNDSGHVAFSADLTGTLSGAADDEALLRGMAGSSPLLIAREGELIAGGPSAFGQLFPFPRIYVMDNAGIVAFRAPLTNTPGGSTDDQGIYTSSGPGTLTQHVRKGDIAPGYGTAFTLLNAPTMNHESPASLAFYAAPGAIYIERGGSVSRVCWFGQPSPDGNGSVFGWTPSPIALRPNASEIALVPHFFATTFGSQDDDGLFIASAGSFVQVARGRQPAPGGSLYGEFGDPVYNIDGNAAFSFRYNPTSDGSAIVRSGALIVKTGQPAPDLNGTFSSLLRNPSLSAGNLVAFGADMNGTVGGGLDDSGIYRGDGVVLFQCAREDQSVPEGNGRFASFGTVVGINLAGQVLFTATLRGTSGGFADNRGIYLWDEVEGLTKLLRLGDVINGRTVTDFNALTDRDFGGFRSLNDASEAVARVRFTPFGGDGIFVMRYQRTVAVEPPATPAGASLALAPNPAPAGSVVIQYRLPAPAPSLDVRVFDLAGRSVRTLGSGPAGERGRLAWDGADDSGRPVAAGMYVVRLTAPGITLTRRLVRIP